MNFEEYPKVYALGKREVDGIFDSAADIIVIQEKVDGANFRFMIKDGIVHFGSHHGYLGGDYLKGKSWKVCIEFILEKLKDKDLSKYEGMIFYGECCTKHNINYDFDTMPPYLGYDVKLDGKYVPYPLNTSFFIELGLPFVKTIDTNTAEIAKANIIHHSNNLDAIIPQSAYYSGQAEGLIYKNYNKHLFMKIVSNKFKEVNKIHTKKLSLNNDDEKLISKFGTNARIDKQIYKLRDEGNEISLSVMGKLIKATWQDIVDECADEILNSRWELNLVGCRNLLAKQCKIVLNEFIAREFANNVGKMIDKVNGGI